LPGDIPYRLMFEDNPQPMWMYDRKTLAFLAVNNAAVHLYGYTREEFLAMTIKDIRPPEDVPALLKAVAAVDSGYTPPDQWRHAKKDGTIIQVEITSHTIDFSGRPAELVMVRDLTAWQQAEDRFRELAETIEDVFWVTDARKSRMLYVSPAFARIWGRPPQSLYDSPMSWAESIHPEDRARVVKAAETEQTTGAYDEEYRIVRPDGTVRWIRDQAFPVRDAEGRVLRVVGVARDITEQHELEKQFRHAQKMEVVG